MINDDKNKKLNYSQGVVFGVFDDLHPGHEYFLREAEKRCDKLVVCITQSEIVELFKKHPPKYSLDERISKIKEYNQDFVIMPGDLILGEWSVFKKYPSSIVFLGHDQQRISEELKKMDIPFIFLEAHHPEKYKSSLL